MSLSLKRTASNANLVSNDESIQKKQHLNDAITPIDQLNSLSTIDSDGNKILKFYWIDALQDSSDTVILFGKVWMENKFTSASVRGKV